MENQWGSRKTKNTLLVSQKLRVENTSERRDGSIMKDIAELSGTVKLLNTTAHFI